MRAPAVCALVVRVLGLAVVLWRAEDVAVYIAGWIGLLVALVSGGSLTFRSVWSAGGRYRYYLPDLAILCQFALGLYMLFGGKRLVRFLLRGLPGVPGICERCGYDIAGLEGGRCPECGAKVPAGPPGRP